MGAGGRPEAAVAAPRAGKGDLTGSGKNRPTGSILPPVAVAGWDSDCGGAAGS